MRYLWRGIRHYCKLAKQESSTNFEIEKKVLNFNELKNKSKIPTQAHVEEHNNVSGAVKDIGIDAKQIKLLERLSLVDLSSRAAYETLQSSIQFAQRIEQIPTANVAPLYTVLEQENLQLRTDVVNEGNCRVEVLSNAKITEEDYFVAPVGNIPLEQADKDFANNHNEEHVSSG